MHVATWFPLPPPGEDADSVGGAVSAADFRVAFKAEFQRQVMHVFFAEVQAKTGDATIKDVVTRLSCEGNARAKLRVWYSRSSGSRLPRQEVLDVVGKAVPGLKMNVRHPMLTWLASPDLDQRSVRRLKARMSSMSTLWHQALNMLRVMPTSSVRASPELARHLGLDGLNYLDAAMLFAVERGRTELDVERKSALNQILWLLPILYPDDPLWLGSSTRGQRDRQRWLLGLIDHSLGLLGPDSPADFWTGYDRLVSISDQHWRLQEHRRAHPQACRTRVGRQRYWARIWRF